MTDDSTTTSGATVEVERFRAAADGSCVQDVRAVEDVDVLHLRLARPTVANALDRDVAADLSHAIARIDDSVGAVLLSGQGPRFCAGGDLDAMLSAEDPVRYVHDLAVELDKAFQALQDLSVPTVAAVHGAVAGAGLALMLSCDVVVADDRTKFVPAYPGVGLTPDCGLSWLLPRAVGRARATSFLLRNRPISAPDALAWGMISETTPSGEHEAVARTIAAELAAGPREALAMTKVLIGTRADRRSTGLAEASAVTRAASSPQARRLMAPFRRS